ncbi:cation diffusion facilitator family transporter [Hippea sp. KM1]|uniref:cation diffusion facilitator family transporter n=1 Tax=Hippea sp. KM1 TaxID=944481 RepID=UPI00046C91A4|nr:cation diffusion facilitator family transporter [Hippea sp. KM1]
MDIQTQKERWLLFSIVLNTLMAIAKLGFGLGFGIAVIVADGIHSISDVVSSLLLFLSIKFAGKKSKRFPYGMHKLEDFAAFIAGVLIVYAAYRIVKGVLLSEEGVVIAHTWLAVGFMFLVLLAQSVFIFFEWRAAKKLSSSGMKADLLDWILDGGMSVVAIIGIILTHFGIPHAQKVAVAVIALGVFHEAFEILKDSVLTLLDASVDPSIIERAKKVIEGYPEVESVDMLFIRKAGSIFIADIILKIHQRDMEKAHKVIDRIEESLKNAIENLKFITIHYEPAQEQVKKVAILVDSKGGVAKRFRDVEAVRVKEFFKDGELMGVYEYRLFDDDKERGRFVRLISWLLRNGINELVFDEEHMQPERRDMLNRLNIKVVPASKSI